MEEINDGAEWSLGLKGGTIFQGSPHFILPSSKDKREADRMMGGRLIVRAWREGKIAAGNDGEVRERQRVKGKGTRDEGRNKRRERGAKI